MKMSICLFVLCLSQSLFAQNKLSEAYFKDQNRVLKIKANRPLMLDCALTGTTRLKKEFIIEKVSLGLNFDDNKTEVVIDSPATGWGNWAVSTVFPLVDKKSSFKLAFNASRKDVTNIMDEHKEIKEGVLLNESVKMTFETSIDHLKHFVRMGSGLEEMTDWDIFYTEYKVGSIDDVVAVLKLESNENKVVVGKSTSQNNYLTSTGGKWLDSKGNKSSFLNPVSDDLMFMYRTKDDNKKLMELNAIYFSCEWDAKDIKI